MKNIKISIVLFLFTAITFPQFTTAQPSIIEDFSYEVNRVRPYISVSPQELKEAQVLTDLNNRYKTSWVREYISVEVLATVEDQVVTVMGKSDSLNQEQKELMVKADAGTDISVLVKYIPENTLKHNDPKEINFTVAVDPDREASFVGGSERLMEYLKEKAIDVIPEGSFEGYDLAAVQFAVSEEGEIMDVRLFDSSMYNSSVSRNVNALLLEAVRNMPCWKPAEYANGLRVKQEFVLTVGNMKSCVVNLLNIRSLPPE